LTPPPPEPLLPLLIVSQLSLLVAVHEQPAPALTFTLPVLALEVTEALGGEME